MVDYGWMKQFPPSKTSGKTETSSWNNTLRYPKFKDLPRTNVTYPTEKGLVHLTEGVNPEFFD